MTGRPLLSQLDIWGQHAKSVIEVLHHALRLLAADCPLGLQTEPEITREFYLRILRARLALLTAGAKVPEGLPVIDGRNAPTPETAGTTAERKLPDIQWGYQDVHEPDPDKSGRFFHIECKRLGGSHLNSAYVDDGVVRFISPGHRYGKDVREGAMVGYVVEGEALDALKGVNGRSAATGLPMVVLVADTANVSILENTLIRVFPKSPFKLHHAWLITYRAISVATQAGSTEMPPGAQVLDAGP